MIQIEGPEKVKLKKKMANAITEALLPCIWCKNWISVSCPGTAAVLSCLHGPAAGEKPEVQVSRRQRGLCEAMDKQSFAFCAKSSDKYFWKERSVCFWQWWNCRCFSSSVSWCRSCPEPRSAFCNDFL